MFLPELTFADAEMRGEEIYLAPNSELARVLIQGNPSYMRLMLPGLNEYVHIGFPETGEVLVYEHGLSTDGICCGIGRNGEEVHKRSVQYRYGMELKPWLLFAYLPQTMAEARAKSDNIINYTVLNCASGHSGVIIRITRHADRDKLPEERLEIYRFDMGSDSGFASKWRGHQNTRLLARFAPISAGTPRLTWVLEPPDEPLV